MKRALAIAAVLIAAVVVVVLVTANSSGGDTYRVRAVFMNAFSAIRGEDVKIAGVKVGKIESIDVTKDRRAAVVLRIDRKEFQDFRRDAECTIRPQSLIGEKYVECTPTQPRPDGTAAPPELATIKKGDGQGQRLLPVSQTSQPVDIDLINNVMRLPYRQRFSIILNELGTGLAGRGSDLRQAIRNADPALKATDQVINLLARQNQTLEQLAVDGDRILAPLARDRARVADFVDKAGRTASATAQRSSALEADIQRLPQFLRELRPTMVRLGALSDEMTPVLSDLGDVAPDLNRFILELGPFARAGIPAFQSLGQATDVGRDALVKTKPIIDQLQQFTKPGKPLAANLQALTTSLKDTGGIERLMDYLFYQVAAINGFDTFGHYLRAGLILNACTDYVADTRPDCTAKFTGPGSAGEAQSQATAARATVSNRGSSALQPGPIGRFVEEAQALYRQGKDPALAAQRVATRDAAAKASKDRKARAKRGAKGAKGKRSSSRAGRPLALPTILPGADPAPAPARGPAAAQPQSAGQPAPSSADQQPAAPSSSPPPQDPAPSSSTAPGSNGGAQTSLLDYLLGGGS